MYVYARSRWETSTTQMVPGFLDISASRGAQLTAMRISSYILAATCAVCFSLGSTGSVWLCVRADGVFGLKANAEALCESEDNDANAPVDDPTSDNCCLDIPIGLDGGPRLAKPARPRKANSSSALRRMGTLCTRSVPTAAEFGLLTQSQPADSSHLSSLTQTVVLLI